MMSDSTSMRPLVGPSTEKEEKKVGVSYGKGEIVLIPKWQVIPLEAMTVKEELGRTVTRVET